MRPADERTTRLVGLVAVALAAGAMAVDHLLPGDWAAFLVTAALSMVTAAVLFGRYIPRVARREDGTRHSAAAGLLCSVLAIVPGIALLWLGFPIVVGGAGLALGLLGRAGERRLLAGLAVALGTVAMAGGFAVEVAIELTSDD